MPLLFDPPGNRMKRASFACAASAMLVAAACSGDPVGRMMPESAPGVSLVAGEVENDTARIAAGPLAADVAGSWAREGLQELSVTYTNRSARTLKLPVRGFTLTHQGEAAQIVAVSDITGVSVADADPTNDKVDALFDADEPGTAARDLVLPAGGRRTVVVFFANFQREGNRPSADATLIAGVPLASATTSVRFRCAD